MTGLDTIQKTDQYGPVAWEPNKVKCMNKLLAYLINTIPEESLCSYRPLLLLGSTAMTVGSMCLNAPVL